MLRIVMNVYDDNEVNPFFPTVPTWAARETASLGIMGAPRVPPLCLGQQMLER